jgi:hypothetical protein
MSATTVRTATATEPTLPSPVVEHIPTANPTHKLFTRGANHKYGDFRDDLVRDGYAIIKGAIPRERADQYADQFHQFLEDL